MPISRRRRSGCHVIVAGHEIQCGGLARNSNRGAEQQWSKRSRFTHHRPLAEPNYTVRLSTQHRMIIIIIIIIIIITRRQAQKVKEGQAQKAKDLEDGARWQAKRAEELEEEAQISIPVASRPIPTPTALKDETTD
jgi:hypothetical protein